MNSRERIAAVLSGKPVDRRPVSMLLSLYGARLSPYAPATCYADADAYVLGQERVYKMFQPDVLFGPFAMSLYGQAFGSGLRFYDDQPPNLKTPVLGSPERFNTLALPDPDTTPCLVYMRRVIRLLAARYGNEVPIAATALDPVSLPIMIMGLDRWLQTFLFEPGLADEILGRLQPFFREWVNILFAEGASLVVLPMAFTTPVILPRKLVIEGCLPTLEKAFSDIDGPLLIHSTGAPLSPFLDLFAPLPHVKGAVLNDKDTFEEARKRGGEELVLIGNLDGPGCNRLSARRMREKCTAILQERRDDPYFVLGSTGPDIPLDTPPEVIQAVGRAVEDFKR